MKLNEIVSFIEDLRETSDIFNDCFEIAKKYYALEHKNEKKLFLENFWICYGFLLAKLGTEYDCIEIKIALVDLVSESYIFKEVK